MPPHVCSLIRRSIKPVPWNRTGYPPFIGLGFALVPAIAFGGSTVARVLSNTAYIARSMRVDSFIGGAVTRGDPMFCEATACVVPVVEWVGKVETVCGRVALRGSADCILLGLIVGGSRGVSRAERE